jgi:hypothetical protein
MPPLQIPPGFTFLFSVYTLRIFVKSGGAKKTYIIRVVVLALGLEEFGTYLA